MAKQGHETLLFRGFGENTAVKSTPQAHGTSRKAASLSRANDFTVVVTYNAPVAAPTHLQTKEAKAGAPGILVAIHHVFSTDNKRINGSDPVQACKSLLHTHTPSRGGALFCTAAPNLRNRVCALTHAGMSLRYVAMQLRSSVHAGHGRPA